MSGKPTILIVLLIAAVLLGSCAAPEAEKQEMLVPGDRIGEMVITEAEAWDWSTNLYSRCEGPGDRSEERAEDGTVIIEVTCQLEPETEILLSCGGAMADPELGEDLDTEWSELQTEMMIDGREIDMSSFGWVEYEYKGPIRTWNVQLENLTPGMHTFYCRNEIADGDVYENSFHFDVRAMTYPPLPVEGAARQHSYTSEKAGLNLLLYFPDAYGEDPQKEWPLVLYLHGGGEKGANLESLKGDALPGMLEDRGDLPFIVASPQLSGKEGEVYWPQEAPSAALITLLEELTSAYAVDTQRIYFTGYSDGGGGVWEIGLRHPDYFAALVPVAGYYGYLFEVPDNICDLKDVPIWAFHGAEDDVIPLDAQQGLVEALEACGGDVQFTVYPDRDHDISDSVYGDLELRNWLLAQKLD